MTARLRAALYGGSFDPVHVGHLETARRAERVFGLERVLFVPAARPPHKLGRQLADGPLRLAMLYLATVERASWAVSEEELAREGPSYTFDTVRVAPRLFEVPATALDLHLIIGSDNLPGLPDWHHVHDLLERVQPIVAWRHGDPDELLAGLRGRLAPQQIEKLERGFLRLPPIEVSSSDLRARLAAGEDCTGLIPDLVLDLIQERGAYGWPAATGAEENGADEDGAADPDAAVGGSDA
ncbi:MAG: nicotinate (nicotinamide) nucleotide adenylyltransferase [Planctomycetota bacterium]